MGFEAILFLLLAFGAGGGDDAKPAEPKKPDDKPKPLDKPVDPKMPFGPDAGPIAGPNAVVLGLGGVVWAPFEFIILKGSDEDLWPPELLALPAATRSAIVDAQELMSKGELGCRVIGAGEIQMMANTLKRQVQVGDFVTYHLWLAAMQDGKHIIGAMHQTPVGPDEEYVWQACRAVGYAATSNPYYAATPGPKGPANMPKA